MPITKHNYLVKDLEELPCILKEAFHVANTGRKGPVLIDLPKDLQAREGDFSYPARVELSSYKPTYEGHPGQIARAANAIKKPIGRLFMPEAALSARGHMKSCWSFPGASPSL